jgi:hypothetical protein
MVANVNLASSLTVSNQQVAVFTEPDTSDNGGEFAAQIAWGDGNSSAGTVQEVSPGLFAVLGSHTYASYDWYTMTVTLSQGWGGMAAVADGEGENGGKKKIEFDTWQSQVPGGKPVYQSVQTLAVGKWENAFKSSEDKFLSNRKPVLVDNFLSLDPDRFWVQVEDPIAYQNKDKIQVYVETSNDIGHFITLNKSTKENVFGGVVQMEGGKEMSFSPPLLLTSVSVDKVAGGDQTLLVMLGDTVRAIYGNESTTATVPVKAVVKLHVNILRVTKGGKPVATPLQVLHDGIWANAIYAQVGIRFILETPIHTVDPPPKVDLRDGLAEGSAKELADLLDFAAYRTPKDDDIEVYYVNFLEKNGAPDYLGESIPASGAKGLFAKDADSSIISADTEDYQTLAREIGHVLMDGGRHLFGYGKNQANLMARYASVHNTVSDSRRLTAAQAKDMIGKDAKRPNLLSNP